MQSYKRNSGYGSKLIWALALLVPVLVMMQTLPATDALAAGTVGGGTPGTCTEGALVTALSGGGAVTFNCGASPITITVTSQKTISFTTSIDGGGLVTLSGGNTTGVLSVNAGVTLTLRNVTIANGNAGINSGGGVNNQGALTVTNSIFINNHSANINGYGGGGVYNSGSMTITNSLFSNNYATSDGGGVDNYGGTLTIMNSTFYSNSTDCASCNGGGVNSVGNLNITNSTFYSNTASTNGGGVFNGYIANVTNSTFSNNGASAGGGFYISGILAQLNLWNTIISKRTLGQNCYLLSGSISASGNSQADDTSCGSAGQVSTAALKLGPLANNGGHTPTMAIASGSSAINNGYTCPLTDQRGYPRPGAPSVCDTGAYQSGLIFRLNLPLIMR